MIAAAASVVALAALAFTLWRWLLGPVEEPPGWDVPPADWCEGMRRMEREGDETSE